MKLPFTQSSILFINLEFLVSTDPLVPSHPGPSKVCGHIPATDKKSSLGEIAFSFQKGNVRLCYYSANQVKMLDSVTACLDNTASDSCSFNIPDFISKQELDSFLDIFRDGSVIGMMDAETLAHTLRMADYLQITEKGGYILDFFSRVCRHSILGKYKNDILNSQLYALQPKLTLGSLMYTYLAQGLANVLRLQISILEERKNDPIHTLVFRTQYCEHPKQHKVLGFSARITNIKITRIAQSKIAANSLDIIIWLFVHIGATSLDLSGCRVDEHTIVKIARLKTLEVLNLSSCDLPPDFILPICIGHFSLREVLHELDLSYNKISLHDTKALALLTTLHVLNLSHCDLPLGSLVPIGNSPRLQKTLRELNLFYNKHIGIQDIEALTLMTTLKVLNLNHCDLQPGLLVSICTSPRLRRTLRELYLFYNSITIRDMEALALLAVLRVLNLDHCNLPPGSLIPICNSLRLRNVLRKLGLAHNKRLSFQDTRALSSLAVLKVLDLSHCDLPPNFLVPIGNSRTLQLSLRELHADHNKISARDINAFALTALRVLNLSHCDLPPGSLVPIGDSPTLRSVLRDLNFSYNRVNLEDTTALAFLVALQILKLKCCRLPSNSLLPIGNSPTLRNMLRELDLAHNKRLSLQDVKALSSLAVLQVLKLSLCRLPSGSLIPIGKSPKLKKTLRELDVSHNRFLDLHDTKALALLTVLQVLNLSCCSLRPGLLVPIGNSPTLQPVLRELDLSHNKHLSLQDMSAIAALLNTLDVLNLSGCGPSLDSFISIYNDFVLSSVLHTLHLISSKSLDSRNEKIIPEFRRLIDVLS